MKNLSVTIIALIISVAALSQQKFTQTKSRDEILNEEYCSGIFKTADAIYFDFMDERISNTAMGHVNILDWLQGRVAGLQVYNTGRGLGPIRIPYIRNQRAGVFVDEIAVNYDWAGMVPIQDIAMIKIIKRSFWGGSPVYGNGGAILIYTKGGEDEEESEEQ